MKRPHKTFLLLLAKALREAGHKNVAEHIAAGLLWALYPEWYEKVWEKK